MAVEEAHAVPTTLPSLSSASSSSSSLPPTVGALLTRASAAVTNSGASSCDRERSATPRSLLSRILHRGRARGGGGFGCRLRLPLPRYCSSGAGAAKEDANTATTEEAAVPAPAPKVVGSRAESPRSSLSLAGKKAEDALPASLGLGASLVLLLSRSAAELSRMAELRAQMERLMTDVRADVRSCNGRPSASDGAPSLVVKEKELVACAGDEEGALVGNENAAHRETIDQMEAELEAELSRLQLTANDEEENIMTPQRDDHLVEAETKSGGATSGSQLSVICSDVDDGETDHQDEEEEEIEDEEEQSDFEGMSPAHGGVSARELERKLHELLQSRHEARIAELESALERARWKLKEKEREACRWRDTAKLAARFTDESRLR